MTLDIFSCVVLICVLFTIGVSGLYVYRSNLIIMLLSIEVMLLAVYLSFIMFSIHLDDLIGQIVAVFILAIAAAESAIGLAFLVLYNRIRGTIRVEFVNLIKG